MSWCEKRESHGDSWKGTFIFENSQVKLIYYLVIISSATCIYYYNWYIYLDSFPHWFRLYEYETVLIFNALYYYVLIFKSALPVFSARSNFNSKTLSSNWVESSCWAKQDTIHHTITASIHLDYRNAYKYYLSVRKVTQTVAKSKDNSSPKSTCLR